MTDKNKLFQIIDVFKGCNVLVVGDIILDEYIWGKANRLSPEAPVPVLEVEKYDYIPGGAANVASNIKSLGGNVSVAGVLGQDSQADTLKNILEQNGIESSCLIKSEDRHTTVKTRLLAHNRQQLVRLDRESKEPINEEIEQDLMKNIQEQVKNADLILLSDYGKGVLTESFLKKLIALAKEANKPVLVDPKGLDFRKYSGVFLITPNRLEAEMATKSPHGTKPEILARKLRKQLDVRHVLITLGEEGVLFCDGEKTKTMPAVTSEVYDVTGAGDSFISAISLAMIASKSNLEPSVKIANYAAGVAVRKIGTTAVNVPELKNIIKMHFMSKTMSV